MSIWVLYNDFKEYRKARGKNKGAVACCFIPLVGDPWEEMLTPDKDGFATNKRGWRIFVDPLASRIYGESLPQEMK